MKKKLINPAIIFLFFAILSPLSVVLHNSIAVQAQAPLTPPITAPITPTAVPTTTVTPTITPTATPTVQPTVTPTPVVNQAPVSNIFVRYYIKKNTSSNISFRIFDRDGDKVYTYIATNLPAGLKLTCPTGASNLTCTITGGTSVVGTFNVNIVATDAHGLKSKFTSQVIVK